MPFAAKIEVKLLLLITGTNLVLSCLITNCPRGGKRDNPGITVLPSGFKKLCHSKREDCSDGSCQVNPPCGHMDIGQCISHEICCSKDKCEHHKSCRLEFPMLLLKKFKSSSVILEKLLGLLFNVATYLPKEKEPEMAADRGGLQFPNPTN